MQHLQWALLAATALVAALLITTHLVLGLLPEDALIFLVYLPFNRDISFRI